MSTRSKVALGAAALIAVTALWFLVPVRDAIEGFRAWLIALGAAGVALYVGAFVATTVALGPVWALTLVAGLAYGFLGIPLVMVSATLGASASFALGRTVARERVLKLVARERRLQALDRAVGGGQGWKVVGLLHLSPVLPFGLQNYLFSVTGIGFVPFALATFVGVLPGSALYVYLGSLGRRGAAEGGALRWTVLALGLVVTVAVVWYVTRRARAMLERLEREAEGSGERGAGGGEGGSG